MQTHSKKLIVLIGEAALEKLWVRDVRALGAQGYTVTDVRGSGSHGARDADWEGDRSIRMEVICDAAVAEKIAQHVLGTYSVNYPLSVMVGDVAVFRSEKF